MFALTNCICAPPNLPSEDGKTRVCNKYRRRQSLCQRTLFLKSKCFVKASKPCRHVRDGDRAFAFFTVFATIRAMMRNVQLTS